LSSYILFRSCLKSQNVVDKIDVFSHFLFSIFFIEHFFDEISNIFLVILFAPNIFKFLFVISFYQNFQLYLGVVF
jgi:hypothetical protein